MNIDCSKFINDPKSTSGAVAGGGSYATMYDSDESPDMIIKKGPYDVTKDGWLIWAEYVLRLRSKGKAKKWHPEIYALVINEKEGTFYALMERLKKGKVPYITGSLDEDSYEILKREVDRYRHRGANLWILNDMRTCARESVVECDNLYFDGHNDNWMLRENEQLVLTDPFNIKYDLRRSGPPSGRTEEEHIELKNKYRAKFEKTLRSNPLVHFKEAS